jgi:hypothetical protein
LRIARAPSSTVLNGLTPARRTINQAGPMHDSDTGTCFRIGV